MAITEQARHHLYLRLEELIGPEEAAVLMEHLPPVGWADVATKRDLDYLEARMVAGFASVDQRFAMIDLRFEQIDHRFEQIDSRFAQVDHRIDQLEHRIDQLDHRIGSVFTRLGSVEGEVAGLRQEVAAMELRMVSLFSQFKDQHYAAQQTFQRQLIVALVVALVSMVIAVAGLG